MNKARSSINKKRLSFAIHKRQTLNGHRLLHSSCVCMMWAYKWPSHWLAGVRNVFSWILCFFFNPTWFFLSLPLSVEVPPRNAVKGAQSHWGYLEGQCSKLVTIVRTARHYATPIIGWTERTAATCALVISELSLTPTSMVKSQRSFDSWHDKLGNSEGWPRCSSQWRVDHLSI